MLSLKCLSDMNYYTNANSPSVISALHAADLLNSALFGNLRGLRFIAR